MAGRDNQGFHSYWYDMHVFCVGSGTLMWWCTVQRLLLCGTQRQAYELGTWTHCPAHGWAPYNCNS